MEEDFKTSNYPMSDIYKVMKWIPRSRIDRQEPVDFKDTVVVEGSSVVFPTIHNEFNGIDDVQIFINLNGAHIDATEVLLDFSPLVNGNISLLQAKCSDSEIDESNDTIITFQLDDNVTFTDKTRIITGVESIKLNFGTDVTGAEITNILMRSGNYTYTLSDLENFLIIGKNHVLRKLGHYAKHHQIPKELWGFVYMAGGAYAWLSRWEYETKPMKEAKAEADNYATRLLNQVDNAITNYISDIENKFDHKDLFHATSRGLEWGL